VYLAHDEQLERDVAVFRPAELTNKSTVTEMVQDVTRHGVSPTVATIYGAWLDAQIPHVVTQYADGGTMAQRIDRGLPSRVVRELMLSIARGLLAEERAHTEPIELRPSKVLVDKATGFLLSPFGRRRRGNGTQLRRYLASSSANAEERAYVAPELVAGKGEDEVERDLTYQYLLGLLGWHALVGKLPPAHDGIECFPDPEHRSPKFAEKLSPNDDAPRCSPWLADLIARMTARNPRQRLSSLNEVVRALTAAPGEDLGLVRASYERCLSQGDGADAFFSKFYDTLRNKVAPSDWGKFEERVTSWQDQREKLAEGVALLLAFSALDSAEREPTSLSRIARLHGPGGYDVSAESFGHFQLALIETVLDTLKLEPDDSGSLEVAWSTVLRTGIEYLSRRARAR
jgi:serine/threonine protein kinase